MKFLVKLTAVLFVGSALGASMFGKSKSKSKSVPSSSSSSDSSVSSAEEDVKVHNKAKLYDSDEESAIIPASGGCTTFGIEDLVDEEDPRATLVPTIEDLDLFTQIRGVFNRKTLLITEKEVKTLNRLAVDCKNAGSSKKDSKKGKSGKESEKSRKKAMKSMVKRVIEEYKNLSKRSLETIVVAGRHEMASAIYDLFKKEKITVVRGAGAFNSAPSVSAASVVSVSASTPASKPAATVVRAPSVISSDSDDEHSESAHSIEALSVEFDTVFDTISPKSRDGKCDTESYSYDSFVEYVEANIKPAKTSYNPTLTELKFLSRMLKTFKRETLRLTSGQIQVYSTSSYAKTLEKSVKKISEAFEEGTQIPLKTVILPRDTSTEFIDAFTSAGINVKYDKKLPSPLTPADSTRDRKGKKDKQQSTRGAAEVVPEETQGCRCVIS